MQAKFLDIRDVHCTVQTSDELPRRILKGVTLSVGPGEVHAIMGPNGSGKSTMACLLAGHPHFTLTRGTIMLHGQDLAALSPEQRARLGLFIGFQYPPSIPGVANEYFLRTSLNAMRASRGQPPLDGPEFARLLQEKMDKLGMEQRFLARGVNEGFSGGEKKRNEMLQMALLEPSVAVLDEIDSGLDIDALRIVAQGINLLRAPNRSIILITHHQRLLHYIQPDFVHVLWNGRIVRSGPKELALELEEKGYDWVKTLSGAALQSESASEEEADSDDGAEEGAVPAAPTVAAAP